MLVYSISISLLLGSAVDGVLDRYIHTYSIEFSTI